MHSENIQTEQTTKTPQAILKMFISLGVVSKNDGLIDTLPTSKDEAIEWEVPTNHNKYKKRNQEKEDEIRCLFFFQIKSEPYYQKRLEVVNPTDSKGAMKQTI